MAQTGLAMWIPGDIITVLNDSGTTAITAGDIVFSAANDDVFESTLNRAAYAAGDIKVKTKVASATGYATVIGVALADIAADGYGAIATTGIFMNQVAEDTEAGAAVQGNESADNKLAALDTHGTTTKTTNGNHKIGRALTGGSADAENILWKLVL